MKKIFILTAAVLFSISGFAQKRSHKVAVPVSGSSAIDHSFANGSSAARTTAEGDTVMLSNIATGASLVIYSMGVDSGYLTGTNYYNDQAFAERYSGSGSMVTVIGVFARFGGKVSASSANTVSFNVWSAGPQIPITATQLYSGFPDVALTTHSVPFTQLGIGTTADTTKMFLFDSTSGLLPSSFFVGYSVNYNYNALAGDTIGLASSANGARTTPITSIQTIITDIDTTIDTVINVQNCTQWSDNNWHDNYTDNDSLANDLAIYPIVILGGPSAVKGVTRHDLTFYGSYPNPAVNTTNIKFSLAKNATVTIEVMDMSGRTVNTLNQANLGTGEHIIPVSTSSLPAGDYLYLIRTSGGDGMAGKFTVIR